ncbi:MAG: hypothetical protein HPY59_11000 [Anaerolineae bacterium]|nr:hypothetical protein [Anaerolineae bacterium]
MIKKKQGVKLLLIFVIACGAMGIYLLASLFTAGLGFPLDDAWIHQTYARNLARLGEWSFLPGAPSGGSTSPLWSVLLSIGYLFSHQAFGWAYVLGGMCLALMGFAGEKIFRDAFPETRLKFPIFGVYLILEWHLVWAAASGMETILLAALVTVFSWTLLKAQKNWYALGGLVGLAVWIRPDAITLLGPALFSAVLIPTSYRDRLVNAFRIIGVFLAAFVPYLAFNLAISGSLWPNTFYAKQAEYRALLETPLLWRFFRLASLPLIGSGVLLLPGVIYFAWCSWQKRQWASLSLVIWWLGYTLLFALRLPLAYQHGRYLMPAMPVYFLIGWLGYSLLLKKFRVTSKKGYILRNSWTLALWLVLLFFYSTGAGVYANDVGIIQTEMVKTAEWIRDNTPEDALIAAHDIGALGYFGQRELVDLAGLISPEVISFIRNEEQLGDYLDREGVDYLVTFPGWYPTLVARGEEIYSSDGKFSPLSGGENMAVYKWSGD